MKRVVITGLGVVSPIGNTIESVVDNLKTGKSGITAAADHIKYNFRSQVKGKPDIAIEEHINRRDLRFMGAGAAYNYIAMEQAIKDSGLEQKDISNERTGLIVSSGGTSALNLFHAFDVLTKQNNPKKIGPFMVTRCMSSTNSACLATPFAIKGVNYSVTSACATSAHCIGNGAEQIQMGKQDIVFAGGGEEVEWAMSCMFDAMFALSSKYNDEPTRASRPFDANRDGFVIAGGGGVVVLEELDHARARGAKIYAELTGYGATSDGVDIVAPSGEGGVRSMRLALATLPKGRKIDYINAHGTSTQIGDTTEVQAIRNVFGRGKTPPISSTKSTTGHALGAAGVNEAIFALLMMNHNFIAPSVNVETLDPELDAGEINTELQSDIELDSVLSNSFGFGGTNATLVFSKVY